MNKGKVIILLLAVGLCVSAIAALLLQQRNREILEEKLRHRQKEREVSVERYYRFFLKKVNDVETYRQTVKRQTLTFPEGSLLSLAMPCYAFANVALAKPEEAENCAAAIAKLIEMAMEPWVREHIDYAMHEDVRELRKWNKHGVFLGHFSLMLSCYRLAGGDLRFRDLQMRLVEIMKKGIEPSRGGGVWIASYPQRVWVFDAIPCFLAIHLWEEQEGLDHGESIQNLKQYLRFRERVAKHPTTALYNSEIDMHTGEVLVGPRGCDIAATVTFLGHLLPDYSKWVYDEFKRQYWQRHDFEDRRAGGFREWPRKEVGFVDMDTGPILFGIGSSSSGFGIGAAQVYGDWQTQDDIIAFLDEVVPMIDIALNLSNSILTVANAFFGIPLQSQDTRYTWLETLLKMNLGLSRDYQYRFLIADVTMFYSLSWRPWCAPIDAKANDLRTQDIFDLGRP